MDEDRAGGHVFPADCKVGGVDHVIHVKSGIIAVAVAIFMGGVLQEDCLGSLELMEFARFALAIRWRHTRLCTCCCHICVV